MSRISQRNKRKNKKKTKKRKSNNSGSNDNKRQRFSGYASEIIESEEPEPSPEFFAGETKESDSDKRGREKEEREQKKREEAAERERQRALKFSASKSKPCIANIGGKRVKKNGIITFEGGETFGEWTKQEAVDATGISKRAIISNIHCKSKSIGKKGVFKDQKVMFINAPVDTSDRVHCGHCDKHFSHRDGMIIHVRAKHPEVPLPPARKRTLMPEEYKTFTPPITQKQYAFLVARVANNIQSDQRHQCDLAPTLMALVDG
jgi:hypothetical protein